MLASPSNRRETAAIGSAAVLLCLSLLSGSVPAADSGTAQPSPGQEQIITAELNRSETVGNGCRLSFVIHNRTPHAFSAMQWDLVFFGTDGLIAGREAAEAAPLPPGKTSVKLYDLPGLACDRLDRVLLNDVVRCESERKANQAPIDCLQRTRPSSRSAIGFIK